MATSLPPTRPRRASSRGSSGAPSAPTFARSPPTTSS
jgi:hypothetical protein